jgi:hypothetical protein
VWSSGYDVLVFLHTQEKSGTDGSSPDASYSNIAGLKVACGHTAVVLGMLGAFVSQCNANSASHTSLAG